MALTANPNTGALVIVHGQDVQIGGTSWSAPVWAGFCALINEALERAGKPALGFADPAFYPLAGTAAVRDITLGTNGAFIASPGHDRVTGIGLPDLTELIKALAGCAWPEQAEPASDALATTRSRPTRERLSSVRELRHSAMAQACPLSTSANSRCCSHPLLEPLPVTASALEVTEDRSPSFVETKQHDVTGWTT